MPRSSRSSLVRPRLPVGRAVAAPMALAALAAALLATAPAAQAQAQYKWKDARGQLHVSDMPPPRDVPERDILQRPAARPAPRPAPASAPAPGAASAAARSAPGMAPAAPVDPELARRRQQQAQQAAQQAEAEARRQAAVRADNCQRARDQLALLQSGQRLVRLNAAGEPVVVDEAARQADIQRTQQVMRSECR